MRQPAAGEGMPAAVVAFTLAAAIGAGWTLLLMPLSAIAGGGALWAAPGGDNAQALAGHLAFQLDAWRLPPLFAHTLFWPGGLSVAMTDSNSLFSLLAKLAAGFAGHPVNLLGAWWALCWAAQPVAAVYALRGFGVRALAPSLAAAALAAMTPALLFRINHVNLCGHFLLLLMLGTTLRLLRRETTRLWCAAGAILAGAILSHPYLFAFDCAVLAALPVQRLIEDRRTAWPTCLRFLACCLAPLLMFTLLSGTVGGGDHGFAVFSMNLLSPVWPQHSGLFGAGLPVIDATGGQGEGFNYLGGGTLLLVAVGLAAWLSGRRVSLRPWRGLLAVLAGLFVLALSSRVYAGQMRLLNLGLKPWEDIFAPIRASGRAFWPVGYAIMLAGVTSVAALPRLVGWPLLALAVALQWIDTTPLRHDVQAMMDGGSPAPALPVLPTGGRLLTITPSPGCGGALAGTRDSNLLLLAGVRAGMALGDIGVGRPPRWFNCEKLLTDTAERPMQPGELRIFTDAVVPLVRQELLGPATQCTRADGFAICVMQTAPPVGEKMDLRHGLAELHGTATGAALVPLLSFGWARDAAGLAWSEGPRATLAFRPPPGARHLSLRIDGVADRDGGSRAVTISSAAGVLVQADLPDAQATTIDLDIPDSSAPLWLAFDMNRPVDPVRRGLKAPVNRAALRLISVTATP